MHDSWQSSNENNLRSGSTSTFVSLGKPILASDSVRVNKSDDKIRPDRRLK